MNQAIRIQKIDEVVETYKEHPHGIQDVSWKDTLQPMPVFKIPLNYLIFNKYNGRILSRTQSLERQGIEINPETDEGNKIIAQLLWHSSPNRNKQTLESLNKIGQEKVGIITRDGIIIDGNRRAMLLNKTTKYSYFKTVVLPVTLEEDPLEIEKLETTYQMGEDEKLSYNAIEKYLKAKGLKKKNVSIENIASWMGETETTIKEYLQIVELMDDYLNYLKCDGIYTQLDEREDHFKHLNSWLQTFENKESNKGFPGYKKVDVDFLRLISYDYIRIKFNHRDFREIASGLSENHFFGDKLIWESFCEFHFDKIQPIKDLEEGIDFNSDNLDAYLRDRNSRFEANCLNDRGESYFDENFKIHKQQLENKQSADKPVRLVGNALNALVSIDQKNRAFKSPEVMNQVKEINRHTNSMLQLDSPEKRLDQVIDILQSLNIDISSTTKELMVEKLTTIRKIAYALEKEVKALR